MSYKSGVLLSFKREPNGSRARRYTFVIYRLLPSPSDLPPTAQTAEKTLSSGDSRTLATGVLTMENGEVAREARNLGVSGGMPPPRKILDLRPSEIVSGVICKLSRSLFPRDSSQYGRFKRHGGAVSTSFDARSI